MYYLNSVTHYAQYSPAEGGQHVWGRKVTTVPFQSFEAARDSLNACKRDAIRDEWTIGSEWNDEEPGFEYYPESWEYPETYYELIVTEGEPVEDEPAIYC